MLGGGRASWLVPSSLSLSLSRAISRHRQLFIIRSIFRWVPDSRLADGARFRLRKVRVQVPVGRRCQELANIAIHDRTAVGRYRYFYSHWSVSAARTVRRRDRIFRVIYSDQRSTTMPHLAVALLASTSYAAAAWLGYQHVPFTPTQGTHDLVRPPSPGAAASGSSRSARMLGVHSSRQSWTHRWDQR